MVDPKIYIIVLNWNGTADTIDCLKSLVKINYENFQIVLVDNNSDPKNYSQLNNWCKSSFLLTIEYEQNIAVSGGNPVDEARLSEFNSSDVLVIIRNSDNIGFAAGNNVGVSYILSKEESTFYTLLLNNDTVVESDFLVGMVKFMDNNTDYVACTPQIRLYEPNSKIWNCGGDIKWYGNRKYHYAESNLSEVPQSGFRDISFVTGCALFFKPKEAGLLTERFYFGEEDFEFSLRLKYQKRKMACVYSSVIYHKVGMSIDKTKRNNLNRMFLFYASRFINVKSYYTKLHVFIIYTMNTISLFRLLLLQKIGIMKISSFLIALFSFIKTHDGISKDEFNKIISGYYINKQ